MPDDDGWRWLILHPESDCLFEIFHAKRREQCLKDGCEDVSGFPEWEAMFKQYRGFHKEKPVARRQVVSKPEPVELERPYHIKYRPVTLKEVLGQQEAVKSLAAMLKDKTRPHSFLFMGPSGTGKTTLARILASEFRCESSNIIEVDAASNTGIDAMRAITETLRYVGFGETPNKMIIIDECHALSKAAWQSLLKSVEEPPAHVYFAFCTTDPGKVPDTIKTRCHSYNLKELKYDDLMDLLEEVVETEDLSCTKKVLQLIARSCNGSPRQALVMLSMVNSCESEEEAATLLEAPLESKEIIDLCRLLMTDRATVPWSEVTRVLSVIPETSPESIRIVMVNYYAACLMRAKGDKEVPKFLDLLDAFSTPCNPTDKLAPILRAIGNYLYAG